MSVAEQTAALVDLLPPEKARSVLDFARYLAQQADDAAWDASFSTARTSVEFRRELADVEREILEGKGSPLRLDDL